MAHEHFDPAAAAELLGRWKPAFIHHPRSKQLVGQVIEELGLPPESTHFDVPKPRSAFPVDHLTTGIAFAFPWHRDTWYSAPSQQVNWWLPIYDVQPNNAMMFDPASFNRPVSNTSSGFDYYQINVARRSTATQVGREVQSRPAATDHHVDAPLTIIGRPGSVLLFSGNHLHASIPNTSCRTRFSVDFRTVDRRHVSDAVGARLVDVECTGTALRDFANVATGESFDESLVQELHGVPPEGSVLVFAPPG